MRFFALILLVVPAWSQAERTVDPTFLHQYIPSIPAQTSDITTDTCQYKPIFGGGIARGVARFAEITVSKGGACKTVSYPTEEQVYVVMEGEGTVEYGDAS